MQQRFSPPAPSSTATLVVTAASDSETAAGTFSASSVLSRTERADTLAGIATFSVSSAISATGVSDAMVAFGTSATSPSMSAVERHDSLSAFGTGAATAFLDYIALSDHFSGTGFSTAGPVFGEFTFAPYSATFIGDTQRRESTPISTGGRTIVMVQVNGNAAATFSADDILTAQFYPLGNPTPAFSPAIAWYTAGGNQTGWEQRQFLAAISIDQAAMLQPSIRYVLDVFRAPSGDQGDVDLVASLTFLAKSPWTP